MSYVNKPSTLEKVEDKIAKIDPFVELPNGGKLYLFPILQDHFNDLAFRIEEQFNASDKFVEQPYYIIPAEDERDKAEKVFWDERSVEKSGSDEEKEWFENWKASNQTLQQEILNAQRSMVFIDGVEKYITKKGTEIDLSLEEEEPEIKLPDWWLRKQERQRINVSTYKNDPYQAKYDFVSSLITNISVFKTIQNQCIMLALEGALTESSVEYFREAAQSDLAAFAQQLSSQLRDVAGKAIGGAEQDGVLELQPKKDGTSSDEKMGTDPVTMGSVERERPGGDDGRLFD